MPLFPRCGVDRESISHLLRDFRVSSSFWNRLGIPDECISSFSLPLMEWMEVNCNSNATSRHHVPRKILFPFDVCAIWFHRNRMVFNPHQFSALNKVVDTCVAIACEFFAVSGTPFQPHPQCSMVISWHALPFG